MPEYRRARLQGGTYFFTVVTYNRKTILTAEVSRRLLRSAWKNVTERYPFTTDAICLLPDHIHCIWTLPEGDMNYSIRWGEIKKLFTKSFTRQVGVLEKRNESHIKRGEGTIWQRRFWEHTIRDEKDLKIHLDYIHYNPLKHGLVKKVSAWPWSSFHRYTKMGYYDREWCDDISNGFDNMKFGE